LELQNTTNGELDKEDGADLDVEQGIEDDEHDIVEGGGVSVRHIVLTLLSLGEGKKKKKKKKSKKKKVYQSEPPRIGLSKLFPDGNYPEGEIQEYKNEYVLGFSISSMHFSCIFFLAIHGV